MMERTIRKSMQKVVPKRDPDHSYISKHEIPNAY